MTWTSIFDVNESGILLRLPANYNNKKVLISIGYSSDQKAINYRQRPLAVNDPLSVAEIDEVQYDFS